MDTARQHWKILRQVPDEFARKVREFMVIADYGEGVLMATENGEGYWFGKMWIAEEMKQATEPTRLDVQSLSSMAQGESHILLLSESGKIYAMGMNDDGQLGLGTDDEETHFLPELISIPHKITSIRCSESYSLALTEDGKVLAWGQNSCGQIGVPRDTANPIPSPHQITKLDPHRVVAVECGCYHCLALTDQGEVYGWGTNNWGQLGDGSDSVLSQHTPTRMLTPSPVQSIAAGSWHTLVLTRTGEVWACGRNAFGQLGLPTSTESSASLVKVDGLPPISQIASHFDSNISIAMSAKRECFAWGQLNNTFTSIPLQLPPIYSTLDSVLCFGSNPHNTPCSVRVKG